MRLIFILSQLGSVLFVLMAIAILPALIMKIRNSKHQVESATGPRRNSLSPRVWIIVTPVLFLIFCLVFNAIGITDYPGFGEVLLAWFQTSLASLIILVTLKLGSRVSASLPNQNLQQPAYQQG